VNIITATADQDDTLTANLVACGPTAYRVWIWRGDERVALLGAGSLHMAHRIAESQGVAPSAITVG
jgi:hypothetical protein